MGEREQRAMGACDYVVNGVTYTIRPLVIQSLCDLERMALDDYKRSYLKTFRENLDLVVEDSKERTKILSAKLDEISRWTSNDLPFVPVYSCDNVPITDRVREELQKLGVEEEDLKNDDLVRNLLSMFLTTGRITMEDVKEWTGKRPLEGRVRYDRYWVTTIPGMIAYIYSALKTEHPTITREEIGKWPIGKLAEAAKKANDISGIGLGNG